MDIAQQVKQKLDAALAKLEGLFMPTPEAARSLRVAEPVREPVKSRDPLLQAVLPVVFADVRIYKSRIFDTKGWTLQNAIVTVEVVEDNDPNFELNLALELQGSLDSPFVQLARQALPAGTYRGRGRYAFPLAANPDSLAMKIQFGIYAQPNLNGQQDPRIVRFKVDGVLAAGYRF